MALVDNKTKIQALLAGINALPEAGSGEAPAPVLQEKAVTPTKAAQSVTPDAGYDGLSAVNVGAIPDEYIMPSGTVQITENGEHDVREAESVNVNVAAPEITLQEKTVTPSETAQTVEADGGYDGLAKVTVERIPDEYEDVTAPLSELNVINGGTAAETMSDAVENTETLTGAQTDLIAQIASELENKAAAGGSGGATIDTCTVNISNENPLVSYAAIYSTVESGQLVAKYGYGEQVVVACGTHIALYIDGTRPTVTCEGLTMSEDFSYSNFWLFVANHGTVNASITISLNESP